MNSYKLSYLLAGGMFVAVIAEALLYYPHLPAMVATHFNAAGNPDGWGTRSSMLAFEIGITSGLSILLFAIPIIMKKLPNPALNLPNKEYWLSPERKDFVMQTITKHMNYLNVTLLLFFFFLFQRISETNISGHPSLGSSFWFLVLALIFSNMFIVIRMILIFTNKDKT